MRNSLIILLFISAMCLSGCYTFTGASINTTTKTFTIMSIEDLSGAAPADYPVKFEQKLRDRILSNTRLTELKEDGDIIFYPTIKKYETDELAPDENNQTTLNRLIVSMEVAYVDKNDPKSNWKKSFNAPNDATFSTTENLSNVESGLLEDVIDPVLIQQIFDEAFARW